MVALQPRFLVLLGLCVAASSSARYIVAPGGVHDATHVDRSAPNVSLPAKIPHAGHDAPELPKPIPSPPKMMKRLGPQTDKLPAPKKDLSSTPEPDLAAKASVSKNSRSVSAAVSKLSAKLPAPKKDLHSTPELDLPAKASVSKNSRSVSATGPELPAKLPVPKTEKRSAPSLHELPVPKKDVPKLPVPKTDKHSGSTPPELAAKVPQPPMRDETGAAPKLPAPASNSTTMLPHPKRTAYTPEPMEHPPIVRPHFSSRDMTGPATTAWDATTGDDAGHSKPGSEDTAVTNPADNTNIAHTNSQTRPSGQKSDDVSGPVSHSYSEEHPNGQKTGDQDVSGVVHEHHEKSRPDAEQQRCHKHETEQ